MIQDGRAVGRAIALKHLLEKLELKDILPFAEREKMIDKIQYELERIPALKGEALNDAKRSVGVLWSPVHSR
jgi:hypothetical protein